MNDTARQFEWRSAAITDRGCVRRLNEDAVLERPEVGLWAVADGMGGHEAGDVASAMIVESLRTLSWRPRLLELVAEVESRLGEVNRRLMRFARESATPRVVGSTVAVLAAVRGQAMCLWAGDSRVYRLRDTVLQRMTRDHSEFEELRDQGLVAAEDEPLHASGNVITRAVGGDDFLELDSVRLELRDGDRFILCSDGLYKELSEPEIAAEAMRGDCRVSCRALVDLALARGSRDNVTVVVAQFN